MSRIQEALVRAGSGEATHSADTDSPSWDLGTPLPWDLGSPSAALTSQKASPRRPPVHVLADASQRSVVPIRPGPSDYSEKLIIANDLPAGVTEQYRRLGAALHQAQLEHGIRVVMVASAMPAEGKTLVSSNLALVLSHSYGRRVLLVDADLRRPSLHAVFGLENTSGIADRLGGDRVRTLPPVQLSPTLDVLVAGKPQADPLRIVTGDAMRLLVEDAAAKYDWVILDTPPIGLLPDAHLLGSMADKVLLIIEAGKTPYGEIQKAIALIGKERILGTVLNRAAPSVASPYITRYDQYYGASAERGDS